MNNRIKYLLILVSTLLIGMAIGFLINGRVTSTRIENMKTYYHNNGFNRDLIRIIEPTPEQKDIVIGIIQDFGGQNIEMMESCRNNQILLFQEMRRELDQYLTSEQIDRLNSFLEERRNRVRRPEDCRPNTPCNPENRKHRNRR